MSPGETSATLTTVPVAGAYRWVSCRAFSAFWTVASAPSTAAWADAMLAAIVCALVVLVCPPPPELPPDPAEPDPEEPELADREPPALGPLPLEVVRVGVVRVAVVRLGRVVVVLVVGVVDVVVVVVVWVVLVCAGVKSTNSVAVWAWVRVVVLAEPEVAVCASALARLSCAEVRFSCA